MLHLQHMLHLPHILLVYCWVSTLCLCCSLDAGASLLNAYVYVSFAHHAFARYSIPRLRLS